MLSTTHHRIGGTLLGAFLAFTCVTPALADDSEIYVNSDTGANAVRPNILFIMDTSISMNDADVPNERTPYDYKKTYGTQGNCTSDHIFFRAAGEELPTCSSTNYITDSTTYNACDKMLKAVKGTAAISGRWTGKTAMYDATKKTWSDLLPGGVNNDIECAADDGIHGSSASPTSATHARNGDSTKRWSNDASTTINWTQRKTYTFYSANYLNWRRTEAANKTLTRLTAVKQSVIDLASSVDNVNLGLMRYSSTNDGGYVIAPVADIDTGRANVIKAANGIGTGDSYTPLSETLWEAYQYYSGGAVDFGSKSQPATSVDASRTSAGGATYKTPIIGQCQKNFLVYLTDGLPTRDTSANGATRIGGLVPGGTCQPPQVGSTSNGGSKDDGLCFDDLAEYMHTHDMNTSLPGPQLVTTYTIGFGDEVKGAQLLTDAATKGGGERFDAGNTDELAEALTTITNAVLNVSTTFSTPSVGVNAFNRTQTRDDLYFALFAPKESVRWDGNLKKYKLAVDDQTDPDNPKLIIVGQGSATTDVVDEATGRFKKETRSFWSSSDDGGDTTAGGAAEKLPATRTIYTYLGANPKGASANLIALNSTSVTDAILGTTTGKPTRTDLLNFAYTKELKRMGDPLHSEPALVTYGTAAAPMDVVYVATNDGYLHAIDAADGSGAEKWAFVPRELLPRLRTLFNNESNPNRTYGLDGDIRVLRLDKDGDGAIESADGDAVWLFVGMRRGGKFMYALDVTNPNTPKLMWVDGDSSPTGGNYTVLPGLGETWSSPTIARVNIASGAAQNNQKLVLIFGGGYDSAQEDASKLADDTVGNRMFMVDAKTGALLWYAAPDNTHAGAVTSNLLVMPDMKHSIPSPVTVIDTNGDLFADRMYVGDMGGRVFRFDIFNNNSASTLVTGGVFAELGQGHVAKVEDRKLGDARRFYNQPDVALIQRRGEDPYYNIGIGSGYRGHPLDKQTTDRFYSLRDKSPFVKRSSYSGVTPIRDADTALKDISGIYTSLSTTVKVDVSASGWKLTLAGSGEKVLSQSTTANDTILFTTFQPRDPDVDDPCRPQTLNRAYALKVDNGRPALDLFKDPKVTTIDEKDVFQVVPMSGILGKINVAVLRGELGKKLKPKTGGPATACVTGMYVLGTCVQVNDSVRTYWRKDLDQN